MPRYQHEPTHAAGNVAKTAVLLINLGTPDAPTAPAVRRYLKEFLYDPRLVEIPRPLWWLILNGVILNVRPRQSAAKYAKIWSSDGSPLKVHTERQARLLRGTLGTRGHKDVVVAWAMRYGANSIAQALDGLKANGCTRILILPLYPQYAASSTASAFDAVATWLLRQRDVPGFRFVKDFHDHPGYIEALAANIRDYWQHAGQGDKLVMSFHGLPERAVALGDPYQDQCRQSAQLLARALGLSAERWCLCFQSRFGPAEWLKPYTQATLEALGRAGTRRVDVVCPGFTSDCLETLEEIAMEVKAAYLKSGGREFHYIPCLNERDDWVAALADIAEEHLANWLGEMT
jgi:ferrochelatase